MLSTAESSCGEYTRQEYTFTDWFDYSPLAFDILFIIIALFFHFFVLPFFFPLYIRGSFTRIVHHHLRRRWGLCVTFCFCLLIVFFFSQASLSFTDFLVLLVTLLFFLGSFFFCWRHIFHLRFFFKSCRFLVFFFFSSPFFCQQRPLSSAFFYSVTDKLDFFHFFVILWLLTRHPLKRFFFLCASLYP